MKRTFLILNGINYENSINRAIGNKIEKVLCFCLFTCNPISMILELENYYKSHEISEDCYTFIHNSALHVLTILSESDLNQK